MGANTPGGNKGPRVQSAEMALLNNRSSRSRYFRPVTLFTDYHVLSVFDCSIRRLTELVDS
jgi:hypothetical protein